MNQSWQVHTRDGWKEPLSAGGHPPRVILDNIRSAFNVGSVFRTCEAAGAAHLHLCGICAYPPNARVLKTALGADEVLPWTHELSAAGTIERLQAEGVRIVAVELTDRSQDYQAVIYPDPVAFVFGHEVAGVAVPILDRADLVVQIPMMGHKNSLNVATSVGVILFDHLRRRLSGA